jgi:hypothetical protein
MQHLKKLLESVFFAQESMSVCLSLENCIKDDKNIYEVMTSIKNALHEINVDDVHFNPDMVKLTIIIKPSDADKLDQIIKDFNLTKV